MTPEVAPGAVALAQALTEPVLLLSREGEVAFANQAAHLVWPELEPGQWVGDLLDAPHDAVHRLVHDGWRSTQPVPARVRGHDGTDRRAWAARLAGHELVVLRLAAVEQGLRFTELTRRVDDLADQNRRRLRALQEGERRYASVVAAMSDGLVVHGRDGVVEDVNPAAEKILGRGARELIDRGFPATERLDGSPWPTADHPAMRTLRTGIDEDDRLMGVRRPDGGLRWMALTTRARRESAKGEITGVVSVLTDVTDQRETMEALEREHRALADAQAVAALGSWEWPLAGEDAQASDELLRVLGTRDHGRCAPLRQIIFPAVHPADTALLQTAIDELAATGTPFDLLVRLVRPDGEVRTARARGRMERHRSGGRVAVGTVQDVTDEHRREAALRGAEERFRLAFEAAPIGMALVAPDGAWLRVNQALCEMTGYASEELLGMTFQDITHPDDLDADLEHLRALLAGEVRSYEMEKRYRRADGEAIWVLLSVSLVREADGTPLHFIAQIQDIGERKLYEHRLRHLADHDALTGFFNRRRFAEELSREVARGRRTGRSAALLMLDLDNFKYVNDTLGHAAGDEVIRAVAALLRTRVRATDVTARLGGDEFAVLLPETDAPTARRVADDLRARLRDQHVAHDDGADVHVTASVGVTMLAPTDDLEADGLLVQADLAMYEAKESGRDTTRLHSAANGAGHRARTRLSWSWRIRRALAEDRFLLRFQPIVDLASGDANSYEALVRLADDEAAEPVLPGVFLPIADRHGLMPDIDRWVVTTAIAQLDDPAVPREVRLSINLSARSLREATLPSVIQAACARHGIDPSRLTFEITETAAIASMEEAKHFARRLLRLGCGLALDDFGAGFASFLHLKHLPYDTVKIDGDFIRNLAHNERDRLVVKAIVDVAHALGKKAVAEFVADAAIHDALWDLGVDRAQGHHISPPVPLLEAVERARDHALARSAAAGSQRGRYRLTS